MSNPIILPDLEKMCRRRLRAHEMAGLRRLTGQFGEEIPADASGFRALFENWRNAQRREIVSTEGM